MTNGLEQHLWTKSHENINVSGLKRCRKVPPSVAMVLLPWEPFEDPAISWEKIHGQVWPDSADAYGMYPAW